jgi:hypothetical protein
LTPPKKLTAVSPFSSTLPFGISSSLFFAYWNKFVNFSLPFGISSSLFFTREYTKCTAGSTFCFVVVVLVVVVVVVVRKPLIKLAGISADS